MIIIISIIILTDRTERHTRAHTERERKRDREREMESDKNVEKAIRKLMEDHQINAKTTSPCNQSIDDDADDEEKPGGHRRRQLLSKLLTEVYLFNQYKFVIVCSVRVSTISNSCLWTVRVNGRRRRRRRR